MLGLRRALLALFALGVDLRGPRRRARAGLDARGPEGRHRDPRPAHRAELHRHRGLRLVAAPAQPLRAADDRRRLRLVPLRADRVQQLDGLHDRRYVEPLYLVIVIQMVLSFPTGRLETLPQRATIAAGYLDVLAVRAALLPARRRHRRPPRRPAPGQRLRRSSTRPTWPTSSTTRRPSSPWRCSSRRWSCSCASARRRRRPSAARWRRCCGRARRSWRCWASPSSCDVLGLPGQDRRRRRPRWP